jgi:Polyketide cyclase / dehydrase and lipid transport
MISLKDTSHIAASPSQVWRCFAEMDRHYLDWHPDHVVWRNVEGNATVPNGVIYADEKVGKLRLRGKFHIGRADRERYFDFKMGFPFSLVNAGGWFEIKPTENGECDLVAETHLGYSAPLIGPLMDRVLSACLPLDELRAHMAYEGRNFERLITEDRSAVAEREPASAS